MNNLEFKDIAVVVEVREGRITSNSLELLGKGRTLSDKVNKKLLAVLIGNNVKDIKEELLNYNIDEVFLYENELLKEFNLERYSNILTDFIVVEKPSSLLISDSDYGKALASKLAVRFNTSITSGCIDLDIDEQLNLKQIKSMGTENLLVELESKERRPQIVTVKKSVMDSIKKEEIKVDINRLKESNLENINLNSAIELISKKRREVIVPIEEADVLIVAGLGVKEKKDLELLEKLAKKLNGQLAFTRPVVQLGWAEHSKQVGISGKIVKPSLIITVGVSGAIQFVLGMDKSKEIIAINNDKNAEIFKIANLGIVGDLYEVIPKLIESIA